MSPDAPSPLDDIRARLARLGSDAEGEISRAADAPGLAALEVRYLGKKGELTSVLRLLSTLPAADRPRIGEEANRLKESLASAIASRRAAVEESALARELAEEAFDPTVPPEAVPGASLGPKGHIHPLSAIQHRIEDIFVSLGFSVMDGPEVETEFNNFEALNIPAHHPARDNQDTYWLEGGALLRTHTSPVQIRTMHRYRPPIRAIMPGRVFRREAIDASHENTFYQVEGLVIDQGISIAHLISIMKTFLREVFGREVTVRLRPGYFPFVEPGFELDIFCVFCDGRGCPVCKRSGWVEFMGCGLVHPEVLRHGRIDPAKYSGFAFGMGLNRLVMLLYGIDDIRHFLSGDLRFLRQF